RLTCFGQALHVHTELNRMSARSCGRSSWEPELRQGTPGGDRQLRTHQIDTKDLFGNGMLD
ncbi:MAG TPA: hypothetical protein DCG06_05010, partial [Deltaproteobacteria bacterium]|nr:hypothetical protein [Deltaproteobacteria bacterium]